MSTEAQTDYLGDKFGMWLFLLSELILFGGLFILYTVYLIRYPQEFIRGGEQLSTLFGGANTVVLLTSSLCVALATSAVQRGNYRLTAWLLGGTLGTAVLFLVNKYFEWMDKIGHGIYPRGPGLQEMPAGEQLFFGLYFITTGLHGLHVLIGVVLFSYVLLTLRQGKIDAADFGLLENSGLYWHLVDLIWIFLFPLYYLIL